MSSSNEVSGSAYFQIMKLPAVRKPQSITIGQNFFFNPCPIATMVTMVTMITMVTMVTMVTTTIYPIYMALKH